ncbi:SagB/ThcOx family dehydrogenase [Amycolatopsis orientalis]|uniref:SagB/ThcOx family dehydrogenase n=1 Tax=Amycolatopsis orientalis TaxID=31958 RepID=UPI0003A86EEB|nr:SagB family peptide dehydrogenase [Amycolatopsis orientalis]
MTTLERTAETVVTFRRDISLLHKDDQVLLGLADRAGYRLKGVGAPMLEALEQVRAGLHTEEELVAQHPNSPVAAVLAKVEPFLAAGFRLRGERVAVLERTGVTPLRPELPEIAGAWLRLGKFSLLRRRGGELVVESPIGKYRAVLLDAALTGAVAALAVARPVSELAPEWHPVLAALAGAGFLDLGTDGEFPADQDDVLRQWDVHDLYFHSRSRIGRTDEAFGGRFPYVGQIEPLPAVKPAPEGPAIALYRPEFDTVRSADPGLQEAIEARQSIRTYGEKPITAEQLGEFLYRTARVRGTYGPRPEARMPYEGSSRPYPCGGAGYELELYLTVRRCHGLAPGIYHYDAGEHVLRLVNADEDAREELLSVATLSTGGQAVPDVLVTMTSRFQRLSWKYQSIAYAVTLKHAGALYQTMYLVATAMGLAGCGLGSGDADASARAFKLDYLRESSVGEFILGSAPAELPAPVSGDGALDWRAGNDPGWQAEALAAHRR